MSDRPSADPPAATRLPAGRAGSSPLRRGLRWFLATVAVLLLVVAVLRERSNLVDALARLDTVGVAAAVACMFAALSVNMLSWRALMAGLGSPLPLAAGARVYFVSQLGKYLPGSMWPVLAQMELGREHDVPPARSFAAASLNLIVNLATGIAVGVVGLVLSGSGGLGAYWWMLLLLPPLFAALHPRLLNRGIAAALRLARRPPAETQLTSAAMVRALGWSVLMWIVLGAHIAALAHGSGFPGGDLFVRSTGAYAVSWVVGFLVVVAPAGAGPRELALLVTLGHSLPQATALAVALVSRVITTVCDLAVAAGGVVAERLRQARADVTRASG